MNMIIAKKLVFFCFFISFFSQGMQKNDRVCFQLQDGIVYIKKSVAQEASVLSKMIEDLDAVDDIVFLDVAVEFFTHIKKILKILSDEKSNSDLKRKKKVLLYLKSQFLSPTQLITLFNKANYLDCHILMDVCADYLVSIILRRLSKIQKEKDIESCLEWCKNFDIPFELSLILSQRFLGRARNLVALNFCDNNPYCKFKIKKYKPKKIMLSSDNKYCSIISSDQTIARISLQKQGGAIQSYKDGHGNINTFVFCPTNSEVFASAGDDGKVRVWDINAPEKLIKLSGHAGYIKAMAYSPNGKKIITCANDGVYLFNIKKRTKLTIRSYHYLNCYLAVAYAADGKTIACSENSFVYIYDAQDISKLIHALKGSTETVHSLAYSPKGKSIAAGYTNGLIREWDVISGKEIKYLNTSKNAIKELAFCPHRKMLVYRDLMGITFLNKKNGKIITQISDAYNSFSLVDGNVIACCNDDTGFGYPLINPHVLKELEENGLEHAVLADYLMNIFINKKTIVLNDDCPILKETFNDLPTNIKKIVNNLNVIHNDGMGWMQCIRACVLGLSSLTYNYYKI